jgi:GT2 family glycosyltransferase
MIFYSIPYNTDRNLGKYYNDFMNILPDENDYACFVDGDTIFTTSDYGHIIQDVVHENPSIGCFTALTNRVHCRWQIADGIDTDSNDIAYHRKYGEMLRDIYGGYCIDKTNVSSDNVMSGFLILLKKRTWNNIGHFAENGMLGIDNDLHYKLQKHGEKLYVMKGIYLYHWYRWPDYNEIGHLI